jgi:hypothetical protein
MTYGCKNRAPFPSLIPIPAVYPINVSGHIIDAKAQELRQFPFDKSCVYQRNDRYNDPGCVGCVHKEENNAKP